MRRLPGLLVWILFLSPLFAGCASHKPPAPIKRSVQQRPAPLAVVAQRPLLPASITSATPQRVVLLLPLTGNLEAAGTAVKEGFSVAAQQQANDKISIDVVDTHEVTPIYAAYQRAVAKGADIIVGPLEKKQVAELANASNLSVTTLALNYAKHPPVAATNFYEFGLSPLDEARQAAARAYQAGYRSVLTIVPAGGWGDDVSRAFTEHWTTLGGTVANSLHFKLQDDLAMQVRNVLGITGNQHNAKQRQHNFDVIFLAAPPAIARQIRPLLKFYYAGKIPIYATSFIYTGTPQPQDDQDLNGIIFCDIPWVLQSGQDLALQLASQNPRNFSQNSRLYALGVDAYRLVIQLNDLQASAGVYLQGVTGDLYLSKQQHILRRLPWAIFRHGMPEILAVQSDL